MGIPATKTSFGYHFAQVAWVVKDVQRSEKYFQEVMGIQNFARLENLNATELEGTYEGKSADFVFHLYLGYSGGTMIELIQPVSGHSMYQDFLDKHPEGGIQHIAYLLPVADLDRAIDEMAGRGYGVLSSLNLPVAKVAYFDTYKDIGVATEIIGATQAGFDLIDQLKSAAV